MAIYEIQGPDGKTYEVDAPDQQSALSAFQSFTAPKQEAAPQAAPAAPAAPVEKPLSQQLMDQYDAAMAAGNVDEAKRLLGEASYAATQDGTAPESVAYNPGTGRMEDMALRPDQGRADAAMQGMGQGVSFGTMDEAVGGLYGLMGPGSYAQNRDYALASMRSDLASGRKNHPIMAYGSEIVGGGLTGAGASSAAARAGIGPATTFVGKVVRNVATGFGTGAAYGAAQEEGGDRALGAAYGAATGAVAGALAQPISWAAEKGFGALSGALGNLSGKAKPARAESALAQALAGSGRTADDVAAELLAAQQAGQGSYTLADALGQTGQRALAGVARLGGAARREAADFLEGRQAGQGERIGSALADALGATDTAAAREAAMRTARGAAADTAYDAARRGAGPVDVRGALAAIDDRIGPMQGSGVAGDGIDGILSRYRGRLAAQPGGANYPGASSVELSDFDRVLGVKQSLQDDIGAAVRAGRNNEARELGKVVAELDSALETASGGYRAANDAFRTASREIDQIGAGANAARGSRRAPDTIAEYSALTPQEQAAYRVGYGDKQLARLEASGVGVDKSYPFTSGKSAEELAVMARDPKALSEALGRERTMFETRRHAIGGSQTSDNLADMAGVQGIMRRAPRSLVDALATGAEWTARMSKGQNDATRQLLAKLLLSSGAEGSEAIARAVARGESLSKDQQLMADTILFLMNSGAQPAL